MNVIKRRLYIYSAMCCLTLLISLLRTKHIVPIILLIFLELLIKEIKQYRMVKLILDNVILFIQSASVEENTIDCGYNGLPVDGLGIYISCFGILMDSKIIKFNIDDISLKSVKINQRYLYIIFGNDNKISQIRIIYGDMNKEEIQNFIERFNFETGITPVISN